MAVHILRDLAVLQGQATVLLGLLLVFGALLGRMSPRLRHTMFGFGLLGLLLLPLQFMFPMQWIAIHPAWVPSDAAFASNIAADMTAPLAHPWTATAEPGRPAVWDPASTGAMVLLAIYGLAAALFAGRAVWLWLGARSLLRRGASVDARIARIYARLHPEPGPRVLQSTRVDAPIVFGAARSTILLPVGASTWSEERIEAVLRHELAHVRHRDPLWLRIGDLGLAFYWIHPLYWLAVARLRLEAEHAADDAVLGSGMLPSRYASVLLDLTRALPHRPQAAWATGASRASQLRRRIVHILAQRTRSLPHLRQIVPVALGTLGAVLCSAVLYLDRPVEPTPTPTAVVDPIALPLGHLGPDTWVASPTGDITIEIRRESFRVHSRRGGVDLELPLRDLRFEPQAMHGHRITTLLDALHGRVLDNDTVVYWIDASVPWTTIVNVLYTLGKLGMHNHRLVFVSNKGLRALQLNLPVYDVSSVPEVRVLWAEDGIVIKGEDETRHPCEVVLRLLPQSRTSFGEIIAIATEHLPTDACTAGLVMEAMAD